MASPVYSKSLNAGTLVAPFSQSVPVPAGFVWVVRDISGTIDNAGAAIASVQFLSIGGPDVGRFFAPPRIVKPFHWTGHLVVETFHELVAFSDASDCNIYFNLSGYQLTLP